MVSNVTAKKVDKERFSDFSMEQTQVFTPCYDKSVLQTPSYIRECEQF